MYEVGSLDNVEHYKVMRLQEYSILCWFAIKKHMYAIQGSRTTQCIRQGYVQTTFGDHAQSIDMTAFRVLYVSEYKHNMRISIDFGIEFEQGSVSQRGGLRKKKKWLDSGVAVN